MTKKDLCELICDAQSSSRGCGCCQDDERLIKKAHDKIVEEIWEVIATLESDKYDRI